MPITVSELAETEVPILSQLVTAYGLPLTGETEVELLKQIASGVCGVPTTNLGETEVPLLQQIAAYYGINTAQVDNTEVPLLSAIVLNLTGTTYTNSTVGETEVPLLQQWLLTIANGGGATITGEYLTPDSLQYYVTPDGLFYYQQP